MLIVVSFQLKKLCRRTIYVKETEGIPSTILSIYVEVFEYSRWYLKHDHTRRKCRIGDEHTEDVQSSGQKKKGINSPDQSRRQRVEPGDNKITANDML
jgi:hypothetical protein